MIRCIAPSIALLACMGVAHADAVADCFDPSLPLPATIAACTLAYDAATDNQGRAEAISSCGSAQFNAGNLAAAEADFLASIVLIPDSFEGFFNLFLVADTRGEADTARQWAMAARAADRNEPQAHSALLALVTRTTDGADCAPAMADLMTVLPPQADWSEVAPNDPWLMGNLSYCLLLNNRGDDAMTAYLAAQEHGLDTQDLHWTIADAAFSLADHALTVEAAGRALEMGAPHIDLVYYSVLSGMVDGQTDVALATLDTFAGFLDGVDDDYDIRNNAGWALFLEGRYEAGLTVMDDWMVWAEPRYGQGTYTGFGYNWDTIAHLRAATGDTDGAAAAFRRAFGYHDDAARDEYRGTLAALGIDAGTGDAGILAGLDTCAARGPECRLISDDDYIQNLIRAHSQVQ